MLAKYDSGFLFELRAACAHIWAALVIAWFEVGSFVRSLVHRALAGLCLFSRWAARIFISLDQLLNVVFLGGVPDETISSHAAKARAHKRRWGCFLCWLLGKIDPGHCDWALEPDEGEGLPAGQGLPAGLGLPGGTNPTAGQMPGDGGKNGARHVPSR